MEMSARTRVRRVGRATTMRRLTMVGHSFRRPDGHLLLSQPACRRASRRLIDAGGRLDSIRRARICMLPSRLLLLPDAPAAIKPPDAPYACGRQ